jgi:hypothetical protein
MSADNDLETAIAKAKKNLFPSRIDAQPDPNPLFPRLTEMAGITPLLQDHLDLLCELRKSNIPISPNNGKISSSRGFPKGILLDSAIDKVIRLGRFRPI